MKDACKITRETYDKTAKEYAKGRAKGKGMFRKSLRRFVHLIGKEGLVLDAGCGPGRDSKYLLRHGMDVIGIDYSNKMLGEAVKNVGDCRFIHMDMRNLRFDKSIFDGIWANASILHIPKRDVNAVLSEFRRVLKPNGILYVSVRKGGKEEIVKKKSYKGGKKFFANYEIGELKKLAENCGFKVIDVSLKKDLFYRPIKWVCLFARKVKA